MTNLKQKGKTLGYICNNIIIFLCMSEIFFILRIFNGSLPHSLFLDSILKYNESADLFYLDDYWKKGTQVNVSRKIFQIPPDSVVEIVSPDLMLPMPDKQYIKLYTSDLQKTAQFVPGTPDNKYYQGGFTPTLENALNNQYWNYSATYGHLRMMYCTNTGSFLSRRFEFIYIDKVQCLHWIRGVSNGNVVASCENVISMGHTQVFQLAHFLDDILAPILMFPQEVRQKSVVVVFDKAKHFMELLMAIGIPPERIIWVKSGQWVYAENLYVPIKPVPHLSHYGKLIVDLSRKMKNYYNVTNNKPTKLIFINRANGLSRRMKNMQELCDETQKLYPLYKFEYHEDSNSFKEAAMLWSTSKFIFIVAGSNSAKSIFMQENSILVVGLSNNMDNTAPLRCGPINVFTLVFRVNEINHFHPLSTTCNLTRPLRAIKLAMYVVENGHFDTTQKYED